MTKSYYLSYKVPLPVSSAWRSLICIIERIAAHDARKSVVLSQGVGHGLFVKARVLERQDVSWNVKLIC